MAAARAVAEDWPTSSAGVPPTDPHQLPNGRSESSTPAIRRDRIRSPPFLPRKTPLSKPGVRSQLHARSTRRASERPSPAAVRAPNSGSSAPARATAPGFAWAFELPFYRRCDWAAFLLATVVVLGVYLWTLAPDLTLED